MLTNTGKKKLFISLTVTLQGIRLGRLTQDDLDNGLFFFHCFDRDEIINARPTDVDDKHGRQLRELMEQSPKSYATLVAALEKATTEQRAAWVGNRNVRCMLALHAVYFETLNRLLFNHGYQPVVTDGVPYKGHDIEQKCGAELDVVWHGTFLAQ